MAKPMSIRDRSAAPATSALFADYLQLLKPRIILLLVVTEYCAMALAAHGLPPFGRSLVAVLGLALSAGGAHAVNMWFDRDIDALMRRTADRPLPAGRLSAAHSLYLGLGLQALSFALIYALLNPLTAWLSLSGFVYYVLVYTIWLKRRTPQNIVIGGGAGAIPPLIGWAAQTGQLSLAAGWMFMIIFLWTPAHFWSLALYRQEDYRAAGVPMMPVVRGERVTKWQMLIYTVLLLLASVGLYLSGSVGAVYLAAAAVLGLAYIALMLLLLREHPPKVTLAKASFGFSLLYLTLIFAAMVTNIRAV